MSHDFKVAIPCAGISEPAIDAAHASEHPYTSPAHVEDGQLSYAAAQADLP